MSNRRVKNPVHPLDLSLNSLMVIYKKFEEAKRMSGNPNQQLEIDLLVQLISRLIGQQPSVLQKELTKSMYKKTISWNEFLNFLDQESQARENILDWIMYEMNIRQFKFYRQMNVKFLGHFDEISYYKQTMVNSKPHTLMLLDKEKFVLYENATEHIVAHLKIKRQKQIFDDQRPNTSMLMERPLHSRSNATRNNRRVRGRQSDASLPVEGLEFSPKQKSNHMNRTHERGRSTITGSDDSNIIDEDTYIVRERRKIGSVFQIFKLLPAENANQFVDFVTQKISQRRLGDVSVNDLKDTYKDYLNKKIEIKDMGDNQHLNRMANIKEMLKKMHEDKRKLNYDPLKSNARSYSNPLVSRSQLEKKRVSFQKKERENDLGIRTLTFLQKHQLIAVALYNFDLVLVQIAKEFNKIQLAQQDRIKVPKESDRKKNEVIERLAFHFHQILQMYQILVLVRVQGYSYLRCFNIIELEGRKGQSFELSKQVFNIFLNFQAINMVPEQDYGFHIVGYGGWFKSYKDDLTAIDQHYSLHNSQKFKGQMVISCMAVSKVKRKILFGTVGGLICFYDSFTKEMMMTKKISSKSVVEVIFDDTCSQALIFTADEVLNVYDTNKFEEVQVISVKNEERLNEKINMFSLSQEKGQAILSFYGSEFRQFISYIDDDRNNRKRKIQCTYQWRLNKIADTTDQLPEPLVVTKKSSTLGQQITSILQTDKYFVTMSNQLQLKLYSRKSYKVKYSLILTLTAEQSVHIRIIQLLGFNISHDAKILVYATQDQKIKIVNIYTEQVYQIINIQQKVLHLQFLSERNEYFLVVGSQCGKISFIPSYMSQGKLNNKILQVHRKSVTNMVTVGQYLITTGEEGLIIIWQMPFNIIKFQINIAEKRPRQYICEISNTKNPKRIVCRSAQSVIYELDAKEGCIKDAHQELSVVSLIASCFNDETNELYILDEDLKLTIFQGSNQEASIIKAKSSMHEKSIMRKQINRKQTKMIPTKRKSELVHPADIPSKWKIKSINNLKEKGVQSAKIILNQFMGSTIIFLSKDFFYIYDQLQDRFRGKYNYSTGQFIKNDPKLASVQKATTLKKF